MTIRILLADDHQITREGLCSMLRQENGLQVVGAAQDGRTAVRLARDLTPDVILMDIGMPELNGIEATRQILAANPKVRIIALSMHAERRVVAEMLKAGAAGYLPKNSSFDEVLRAIRTVRNNQTYLPAALTSLVLEEFMRPAARNTPSVFDLLTAREREVLQLLAEGLATKEIAARFHISVRTVETHRLNIMQKLDIHSVAELTKFAIREGLTQL